MGSYTITFTPDDVTNASAVVRVDLGASGARITELTVRAGSGDGLVPGELPGFDLGRLMRTIAPAGPTAPSFELSATPSAVTAAASYTTEPARAPARKTAGRPAAGRGAAAKQAAKQTGAKKAAKAAPGTGRAARAAAAAGTRSGGAGRSATRSSGAAAARTGTSRGGTGRAYRRTPTDIVEVFTQAPSATALARHYGVPRHTVQGWLRRLRAEGILPPSSRAA